MKVIGILLIILGVIGIVMGLMMFGDTTTTISGSVRVQMM